MIRFDHLSVQERSERARVIECLMSDSNTLEDCMGVAWINLRDEELDTRILANPQEYLKMTLLPSRLSEFLKAAFLIRHNYSHWCSFLKDPSQLPNDVFESILEDKMLVFFLFWCEAIKLFHLNPDYPFLICEHVPEVTHDDSIYIIHAEDGNPRVTQAVIDMWIRKEMPGRGSMWGNELGDVEQRLREGNPSAKLDFFSIDYIFYFVAHTFGLSFLSDMTGGNCHTEVIALNKDELVLKCSWAVALDGSDCNTLDTVMQLFPQFPESVGEISKRYVLSSRRNIEPNCSIRSEILNEVFKHRSPALFYDENSPLRNQNILSMMKSNPQLYVRWAVEPKLLTIYRKLIDPEKLYE